MRFFLFCFLFCFSCKNCSKGKWWCNLGVKKKCYEEKHFDISAFLSEEMVLCLRAAAGESWGRIPKATTMTLWELPSWATLTVSPPFCSLTTNSIQLYLLWLLFGISGDKLSEEALLSVKRLLLFGVSQSYIHPKFVLCGHRDLASTQCPGDNLYAALTHLRSAA